MRTIAVWNQILVDYSSGNLKYMEYTDRDTEIKWLMNDLMWLVQMCLDTV
jgi:hypothetical protein